MSFWKRLFSADYRAAVSAEAAGQLEQAAEHYVLAGEPAEAARVHLARAERADSRSAEIDALRDALHWAGAHAALRARIQRSLGRVLLARARDEGIATSRDHQRVREAAELLAAGGDFGAAGEALESIGDTQGAARAYSRGGLVERMETLMTRDEERHSRERAVREAFANYELHMRLGDRDAARDELRRCVQAAARTAEYRRLLDELESRLITGGRVALRRRGEPTLTGVAVGAVVLGRDPLCELPLRAGGVSRRHAEIAVGGPDQAPRFHLRDLGSRNGTLMGGLPVDGSMPLDGAGSFDLGDQCRVEFEVRGTPPCLRLRVASGLDQGQVLVAAGEGEVIALADMAGLPLRLWFRDGRPLMAASAAGVRLILDRESIAHGHVQLVHGDTLAVDGIEVEVA